MRQEPSIRLAGPNDRTAIIALLCQSDAAHAHLAPDVFAPSGADERLVDPELDRRLRGEGGVALVAELGFAMLGLVELEDVNHPARAGRRAERYVMVHNLVVDATARGRGLGRALVEAGRAWAAERGVGELRLHVWEANAGARRMYRELGWVTLGRILRRVAAAETAGTAAAATDVAPARFTGGCLCAGVRFAAAGPSLFCCHCHCRWCRAAHGAAFVTWLGVRDASFALTNPEQLLRWYASSATARRAFCSRCGSTLLYTSTLSPGEVHIARALIEGPVDRAPQLHLFSDHAVDWATLDGELPRYPSDHLGLTKYAAVPPRPGAG